MFDAAWLPGRGAATTPGWLVRAAVAVVVLAVLAGGVVLWAAQSIGDAARTVGRDAEPSVALALGMTATLSDMNAAAIGDSLTDTGGATGTSRQFRDGTVRLSGDLVEAARSITYGEAEAAPLRALQQALAMYGEAVVESRYIGAGDAWITSRRVQWASRVNREFAAPAAQALADANARVLEDRYASYQGRWLPGAAGGFIALAALAAVLVLAQVWLARRTRRLVNPALAAATALCAMTALWFGSQALSAHGTIRTAKQDAYDSLHVLFEAKSAVSAMRADMSLWLLDPSVRAEAQQRIAAAEQSLIGEASHDPAAQRALTAALPAALAAEQAGDPGRARAQVPATGGLLGTELANVTFGVPEREAAAAAVTGLFAADALVRSVQAQAAQDRALAVARWLGAGAGAFAAEQAALDRCIAVNQAAFDESTAAALSQAGLIAPLTIGALAVTVLLALGGLWLRLREYR